MFETTGKLDEALLKETWWQMFGDGNKIVAVFVLLLAAVVVVLGYLWQEPTYYVLAGAVVVVNVLQNAANVYRQRKTSLAPCGNQMVFRRLKPPPLSWKMALKSTTIIPAALR